MPRFDAMSSTPLVSRRAPNTRLRGVTDLDGGRGGSGVGGTRPAPPRRLGLNSCSENIGCGFGDAMAEEAAALAAPRVRPPRPRLSRPPARGSSSSTGRRRRANKDVLPGKRLDTGREQVTAGVRAARRGAAGCAGAICRLADPALGSRRAAGCVLRFGCAAAGNGRFPPTRGLLLGPTVKKKGKKKKK